MKSFFNFFYEVYNYSRIKFFTNIFYMLLSAAMNGVGIFMLIPLLTVVGVGNETHLVIPFFNGLIERIQFYEKSKVILCILFIYIFLIIIQSIINRKMSILNSQQMYGYGKYLRNLLFEKILKSEWKCFTEKKNSEIISAFTTEINRNSSSVIFLMKIISQIIIGVVQLSIAVIISPWLTFLVTICGIIIFLLMNNSLLQTKKMGYKLTETNKELLGKINEQITGFKEIKSYGIENEEKLRAEKLSTDFEENMIEFTKLQSKIEIFYKVSAAFIISFFLYITIIYLKLNSAEMIVVVYVFSRLWPIFISFQNSIQAIFMTLPSHILLENMIFYFENNKEHKIENNKVLNLNEKIVLKNIEFKYEEDNGMFKIENLNIEIKAKEITALVGKSGSGKSTIIDIIMGLLKPQNGQILLDDMIIGIDNIDVFRKNIGYIPQNLFMINGTIRDNLLRFNPNVTEYEIIEALEISGAYQFIKNMPNGLESIVGDMGVKLSGGEKQRIIFARALLRKPKILILDEATSALDNENEYKIQSVIEKLKGKITIIIIAHRLSTIKNADKIIVVDNGKIVEEGDYSILSTKENGYFKNILEFGKL